MSCRDGRKSEGDEQSEARLTLKSSTTHCKSSVDVRSKVVCGAVTKASLTLRRFPGEVETVCALGSLEEIRWRFLMA